jgi:nicotinate-nucleotide adenylyltransferase
MRPIVVLGGTFDPPHRGHFALLRAAARALAMNDDLRLLIAADPWQKRGVQPAGERLAMLRLALRDEDGAAAPIAIDTRELARSGPSYTVDSLRELRTEAGDAPLVFVLGWDQWLRLPSWHDWRRVTDYAHLCIAPRVQAFGAPDAELARFSEFRFASDHALREQPAGLIYQLPHFEQPVSSTQLRQELAAQRYAAAAPWLHPSVLRYIQERGLYTPHASPMPTPTA